MNLKLIGKGTDSIVFRKGDSGKILKFYEEKNADGANQGSLDEDKIRLYHSLQNKFAGIKFVLNVDNQDPRWVCLNKYIRSITFEILRLDSSKISLASGVGDDINKKFVIAEIDYVNGKTLSDLKNTNFDYFRFHVAGAVTTNLIQITSGTQLYSVLSQEDMEGYFLDPFNIKFRVKNRVMHLVVTDILNKGLNQLTEF